MAPSIVEVRRREITKILEREGSIVTEDIARQFKVTTETIRKDIKVLQSRGLAVKCHGGAMSVDDSIVSTLSSQEREIVNQDIKEKIAEKALDFIPDHSAIYLGPGSTVLYIAKLLASRSDLTIFTSSLSVADVLNNSANRVYVLGGILNGKNKSVCGSLANDVINKIAPTVSFMGCSGAEGFPGPTCGQFDEADTLRRIIQVSSKSIVICDSSKFTWSSLICYAEWDKIDILLCDSGLSDSLKETLTQQTQLILVDAK